jgi:hypothetical protein
MASSPGGSQEQEFTVRIPARNERKSYHMMKFNASLNIDTSKWTQVRDNCRSRFNVKAGNGERIIFYLIKQVVD